MLFLEVTAGLMSAVAAVAAVAAADSSCNTLQRNSDNRRTLHRGPDHHNIAHIVPHSPLRSWNH